MNASSSLEFLKAHAVISRSWLLSQIEKTKSLKTDAGIYRTSHETDDEIIRWYDREDHSTFDVCADDHCQRYQGITKIYSERAVRAVEETAGEYFSMTIKSATRGFQNVAAAFPKVLKMFGNRCTMVT